jgi:cytochrome c biogenesis protein CcmG, thiol:disulfide interchange protein DsbE
LKAVIVWIVINLTLNVFGQTSNTPKANLIELGKEAPTFSLPDLNQQYVALRDFCGVKLNKPWINKTKQVVVVSFFATWCKPCMQEIPHLEKIKNDFAAQGVKFLLIDVGEEEAKIKDFLAQNTINLDILVDRYKKIAEKYDALTLPRLMVIDKNGIIRKEQKGFANAEQFETDLRQLLGELLK